MAAFQQRLWRAACLDVDTYEEVEADAHANAQALAVVLLSALATGIGSIENSGVSGILWHTLFAVLGWYVWAYVTYFIGTRWLDTAETVASHGELLRTIGFSSSPGILRVFMLFDPIAFPLLVLCTGWMLVSMTVAVRQALDYHSTLRAIAVCAIGFPIYATAVLASIVVLGPWPL